MYRCADTPSPIPTYLFPDLVSTYIVQSIASNEAENVDRQLIQEPKLGQHTPPRLAEALGVLYSLELECALQNNNILNRIRNMRAAYYKGFSNANELLGRSKDHNTQDDAG